MFSSIHIRLESCIHVLLNSVNVSMPKSLDQSRFLGGFHVLVQEIKFFPLRQWPKPLGFGSKFVHKSARSEIRRRGMLKP